MGFLGKINYSMIVNAFKQVCNRRDCEVFSRMSRKLAHSNFVQRTTILRQNRPSSHENYKQASLRTLKRVFWSS